MRRSLALVGPFDARSFLARADSGIRGDAGSLQGLGGSPVSLLANAFIRRGRDLLIVSLDPGIQDEVSIEGKGFRICIGPYRSSSRARWMDAFAEERAWVRRILERERPDFVHAHWLYEFALGALDTRLPHLVTARDAPWTILGLQVRQHPRGIPYRAVRTAMAYLAGRRTRRMTAVSPYVAAHLRRYAFTAAPIEVVPNGFPSSCFESAPLPRRSSEKTTFVSILNGGFHGLKNGPGLLKALVLLAKKTERFRLVVFGEGCGPGSEAEGLAKTLGIAHLVEFRGPVPHAQVLAFLSTEADAVVHPALEESFGNPIVEGMACGLPVIGGKASGAVPWTLGGGEAGILSDVEDAGELSGAMLELALNHELRLAIGTRAKEYAREHYHIERTADGYEAAYARSGACALGQP